MKRSLLVGLLLLAPQVIFAATDGAASGSLLLPAFKMLGALGVVVGLLLLIYAASRRGFGILPRSRDGQIQMLETKALGGKKFLCLVRVRDQELLLGVSNERIDCLTTLSGSGPNFAIRLEEAETLSTAPEEDTTS